MIPEIIMMYLTKWTKKSIPRRNPYRLHVIQQLHKALDASYKEIRPILMMVSFSGPMLILLVNLAFVNGSYGDSFETRVIPYEEQHGLAFLLSVFMRGQYIAMASLQFWVSFQLFGRLLYQFGKFATKVRRACAGCEDLENVENNNITNPSKTLKDIHIALLATRKLALIILIFSSSLAGYYAAVVLLEPVRQRVSFAVAPFVLLVDVLTFKIIYKVKPKPRRLNENNSARRYIKVGDRLGGVAEEEGTFDERVGDVVYKEAVIDPLDEEEEKGVLCPCLDTKYAKAKRRRSKKKQRRMELKRNAAMHHAKVTPETENMEAKGAKDTKAVKVTPIENQQLYDKWSIDAALRHKFLIQFQKIDIDGSNSIDFDEFIKYYKITENASFVRRLFKSFQGKTPWSSGSVMGSTEGEDKLLLYFQDFVLGLRQFLTMTKGNVILKCFELYDADCSLSLDIHELREMVMDIWGHNASTEHSRIGYIINTMDPDGSGDCDMREWMDSCKKNPVLMKPAFNSQRILREKCFGVSFWLKLQKIDVERHNEMVKAGVISK